jgi:hypothetical protein
VPGGHRGRVGGHVEDAAGGALPPDRDGRRRRMARCATAHSTRRPRLAGGRHCAPLNPGWISQLSEIVFSSKIGNRHYSTIMDCRY